ncbi:MAG TPA: hypothetical protein VF704_06695 [Allosphingosinicella sp.]|jgi:hypothetical protein
MLTDEERQRVIDLVSGPLSNDCFGILRASVPGDLRPRLTATQGNCYVLIEDALRVCEADGRGREPPAIAFLLRGFAVHAPGAAVELKALADRLSIRPAPGADPFNDLIIRSDIPFVDREPLRAAVRKLLDPGAYRPILIVNGGRRSGKSHTALFIDHLARNEPRIKHCLVRILADADAPEVRDLAADIIVKIGGSARDLTAPGSTNEKRLPLDFANDIWSQLTKDIPGWKGTWVIILDGLNAAKMSKPITDFLLQLAENLRTGLDMHRHRLLLTDFDETALASIASHSSTLVLDGLSAQLIRAQLEAMVKALGRDDAAILVDTVMAGLPDPSEDLTELGDRCMRLISSIAA